MFQVVGGLLAVDAAASTLPAGFTETQVVDLIRIGGQVD